MKKTILKKGDIVGLIAPAGAIIESKLNNSIKNIEKLGLKPYYFKNILEQKGYLAGDDQRRINELQGMYEDKNVKAILCVRGGYGTTRIIERIDYNLIKNNPKPLIGYSDITTLQFAIFMNTGQIGFHGIMGAEIFSDYTLEHFNKFFFDIADTIILEQPKDAENDAYTINSGKVKGITIGGNLSLLTSLIGTKFDCDWKDKIIFIEDTNEAPYKIDRMLNHLIMSGKFDDIKGIIFGTFNKCEPFDFGIDSSESFSLKDILLEKIKPLNIPACYGFSFGHINQQAILPFGAEIEFNAETFQISFKRSEFKDFL
jgi:muramoyltetrapeptide carboxypeptidase